MKSILSSLKNNPLYLVGLGLLALCTVIFCLPIPAKDLSVQFLTTYVSLIGYFIAVLANNKRETEQYFKFFSLPHNLLLLLLANLSAYSLNLTIPVFEVSTTWLCVFLVLLNVVLVGVGLRRLAMTDENPPVSDHSRQAKAKND